MELVYCYIKEYKKLKNSEFNFSLDTKFKLSKKDPYQIEVKNIKRKQPKNIYGQNIKNITGIIGQNGTGKTSILEILFQEIIEKGFQEISNLGEKAQFNTREKYEALMIFQDDKKLEFFSTLKSKIEIVEENREPIEEYKNVSINNRNQVNKDINYLYIDNIPSRKPQEKYKTPSDRVKFNYSAIERIKRNDFNFKKYANEELKRSIKLFNSSTSIKGIKDDLNLNIPKKLKLEISSPKKLKDINEFYGRLLENIKFSIGHDIIENNKLFKDLNSFILGISKLILNKIQELENEERRKEWKNQLKIFEDKNNSNIINSITTKEKLKRNLKSKINSLSVSKDKSDKDFKEFYNSKGAKLELQSKLLTFLLKTIKEVLKDIKILKLSDEDISKIIEGVNFYIYFYLPISESIYSSKNYTIRENKIEISLERNKDIKFCLNYFSYESIHEEIINYSYDIEPSGGEKAVYNIFSKLYEALYKNASISNESNKNWIIFLDEPDTMLHPEWQRKILNCIFNFLKNTGERRFQIFFSSHSPYLVSDLAKENLILLKNNEENNESEILKAEKNTFASNIYDSLNNSFFMKSSFGEFSKNKIEKVIEQLKGGKKYFSQEELNYWIKSIGEPLLRNRLENILNEYIRKGDQDD